MAVISCTPSNSYPKWGFASLFAWKMLPQRLGGGISYIQEFKNNWVSYNKFRIKSVALDYKLPQELLAGVCWIEVGGDPNIIDRVAFEVRTFDWSGPKFVDAHLILTSPPTKTSFGAVSMQLRTAANTLGLNPADMSTTDLRNLSNCLQRDTFNINLVARHLRQLIDHDGFDKSLPALTKEQIKIVGARYNRGIGLSIDEIKRNTSYGDFIVKRWSSLSGLLR